MAKANLNDLIEWLQQDEKNRFEIYDLDKNETLQKCASYSDLAHNYPNAFGYFEALFDRGIHTVQIVKKRKNGSTFIREGCGLNFSLSTQAQNTVAASGASENPATTPQQYQRPTNYGGLGAPVGTMGLGFPEIMEMRSQSDRFKETKEENTILKGKVERMEKEVRDLENKCLTYQLGADSKPSAVDKLVEGIAANPAALSTIIQSLKGGNPGLNSPQIEARKLSDIKSLVVDLITNNHQLSDDDVNGAYHILSQVLQQNKAFLEGYVQLLITHKIIDNGSNSSSYSNE